MYLYKLPVLSKVALMATLGITWNFARAKRHLSFRNKQEDHDFSFVEKYEEYFSTISPFVEKYKNMKAIQQAMCCGRLFCFANVLLKYHRHTEKYINDST